MLVPLVVALLAATPSAKPGHAIVPPPLPGPRAVAALARYRDVLLEVEPAADPLVEDAGGTLVARAIWRLPGPAASRVVPVLRRARQLRALEPDRNLRPSDSGDPLLAGEWWLGAVGADKLTPPGPGKPLTVIDSGLDLSHPEFAGRPETATLNEQTLIGPEMWHGTAVASVAAAPANGVGLVGVYPQARVRSYDASPSAVLTLAGEIGGLEAAAAGGPGVANLSFGSPETTFLEQEAVLRAFAHGLLMVAAAGNDRARGNPTEFPAGLPHVLTVGATDKADQPSSFSNASLGVDLAAPGEDIPIAKPLAVEPSGFAVASGTSLSAPIVSGAAAWVWTVRPSLDVTQVFDLLRFSARDVARPGFDRESGFGVLDIRSALASRAPAPDPEEPNDDVFVVRPGGLLGAGQPPIAPPAAFVARLDVTEDPEDVYPLRIPHGARAVVSVGSSRDVDLELWRPGTRTVHETGAARRRDLAGRSARRGAAGEQVSFVNRGPGGTFYVNVFPGPDIGAASYRLSSVVRARR